MQEKFAGKFPAAGNSKLPHVGCGRWDVAMLAKGGRQFQVVERSPDSVEQHLLNVYTFSLALRALLGNYHKLCP